MSDVMNEVCVWRAIEESVEEEGTERLYWTFLVTCGGEVRHVREENMREGICPYCNNPVGFEFPWEVALVMEV